MLKRIPDQAEMSELLGTELYDLYETIGNKKKT